MEPNDSADLHILPFSSPWGPCSSDHATFTIFEEDDEWDPCPLANPEEESSTPPAAEVELKEALLAGRVVRGMAGSDRNSVLRELVEVLPLPAGVSREAVF